MCVGKPVVIAGSGTCWARGSHQSAWWRSLAWETVGCTECSKALGIEGFVSGELSLVELFLFDSLKGTLK